MYVILVGHSEGDDTEQLLDEVRLAHFFLNTAQKILSDYREFCKRVRESTFMNYQAINQSFIVTCQNSQPSRAFKTCMCNKFNDFFDITAVYGVHGARGLYCHTKLVVYVHYVFEQAF